MHRLLVLQGMTAVLILVCTVSGAVAGVPRITKEDAKALLGKPKVVFVDARVSKAWNSSSQRILGAVRPDRWDLESWVADFDPGTTFIIY